MQCSSETLKKVIHKRHKNSIKGDFGKILIIGGSQDYVGAPDFAANIALSVLRSGSDWVTIAAPEKVAWAINCLSPDVITKKIECKFFSSKNSLEIVEFSNRFDSVLIGPGLGDKKETLLFCRDVIKQIKQPKIIDADAIKSVKIQEISNSVITANQRELNILIDNSNIKLSKIEEIQPFLGNNIIISKGNPDIIISDKKIAYNKTGNPGMTVAGTGDILAGIISGFSSQNNSLFDAACAGTYLCGLVGDQLFKEFGNGLLASDFIDKITDYLKV